MDAQQFAQQLQQRKEKNLAFIYEKFNGLKLKNSQLNIDSNTLEVNILEQEQALYPLDANAFNQKEAQTFSDAFKPGSFNHPISRSTPDAFYRGRFFHGSLANFLEAVQPVAEAIKPYTFAHSIPQLVFLGSGLGLHIQHLLKIREIRHVVLVEHNPDRFLASLYATDWEELILPYIQDQTRSFTLSVGDTTGVDEAERIHQGFAGAWNAICMNVPFMPIQTVFYVHQADSFYTKVAARLNNEIEPYVNVWGYYDDEVNQLNHVLHNIDQGISILEKTDLSYLDKITLICGNGPSLDDYFDLIKYYREKIHIIAAGSAAESLLRNDIYPDILATIESDYDTFHAFNLFSLEKLKKINIIGAAQIHPRSFELFSDSIIFFKNESMYANILNKKYHSIQFSPPSASNTALAIAMDAKLEEIYLVGMDFGFKTPTQSHSKSSFYDDGNNETINKYKSQMSSESYKLETNKHGDIYTTPFYNTCRIHAQRCIKSHARTDIKNLSAGATIEGAIETNLKELKSKLDNLIIKNDSNIFYELKKKSKSPSSKDKKILINSTKENLIELSREIIKKLNIIEPNIESIEKNLFEINRITLKTINQKENYLSTFLRGTTWHWLLQFYALCKEYDAERKIPIFLAEFKKHFGGFMHYLPEHFSIYVSQNISQDEKLKTGISSPEPNIEQWFKKVESYQPK
jgi:hypothetical protein